MNTFAVAIAALILAGGVASLGRDTSHVSAQQTATGSFEGHPLVGTWIVDTNVDSETDSPEIGIFTSDGSVVGLGATRWVSGAWEATDEQNVAITIAGVSDANGGGYVVLRGHLQVDATGDAWTCPCPFTLVAPDGRVVDSGNVTAYAIRLPIEPVSSEGMPLKGFPIWTPVMEDATPAS
jgi:hypothetical protein